VDPWRDFCKLVGSRYSYRPDMSKLNRLVVVVPLDVDMLGAFMISHHCLIRCKLFPRIEVLLRALRIQRTIMWSRYQMASVVSVDAVQQPALAVDSEFESDNSSSDSTHRDRYDWSDS
jgi:hypothetical protein